MIAQMAKCQVASRDAFLERSKSRLDEQQQSIKEQHGDMLMTHLET